MPVKPLPLAVSYDRQRFVQYGSQDCANWYPVKCKTGKREVALYPGMGRKHVRYLQTNRLIYDTQPRFIADSIDFFYVIVGSTVYQYDKFFTEYQLVNSDFTLVGGHLDFAFLTTAQVTVASPTTPTEHPTYCMLTDGVHCYIIDERTPGSMVTVTDPNAPLQPLYVEAFANRFVVSSRGSTEIRLTQVNLGSYPINVHAIFTVANNAVFAQEDGIIRQMCVLNAQLYIFTDFTTGIWSNIPSIFSTSTFPWKKNTSMGWNYGIADANSLDCGFDMIVWLAQSRDGLPTFMMSTGQAPKPISTQAINVLIQNSTNDTLSEFITEDVHGFLYQYENTVFYRASAGVYHGYKLLDKDASASSVEFEFDNNTWHRNIELNGERNRIQKHIYFDHRHLVIVQGEPAIYEMAGNIYYNEIRNTLEPNPQALTAFVAYPFRYEMVTPIIAQENYEEFKTDWVQIDFVWGNQSFIHSGAPFDNTIFIIDEQDNGSGEPVYLVAEDGETFIILEGTNTPVISDQIYHELFKPNIFLYFSDDGAETFYPAPADALEFSQLGVFRWRMRWYQLGCSRNRAYRLVCVSPSPIVPLGAIHNYEIVSEGAY